MRAFEVDRYKYILDAYSGVPPRCIRSFFLLSCPLFLSLVFLTTLESFDKRYVQFLAGAKTDM